MLSMSARCEVASCTRRNMDAISCGWPAARLWLNTRHEDAVLCCLLLIAFAGYVSRGYLLQSKNIPVEFWYSVPQSARAHPGSQEKKEARNIAAAFRERVSILCGEQKCRKQADIVQDLDIVVFWGSQTGRAEILATRLARSFSGDFGLKALAVSLEEYDHVHLGRLKEHQICAFVLSTYGDGDPPDNTSGLWTVLHALSQQGLRLPHLRYLLFGLGNSNYRQYNCVADKIDSLFQGLGAVRLGDAGRGDDANGETENDFSNWKGRTQDQLRLRLGLSKQTHAYRPAFKIQDISVADGISLFLGEPHPHLLQLGHSHRRPAGPKVPSILPIVRARRLWETEERLCVHMDLDLGANRFVKYKTGDHLAIWPSNPLGEVERLLSVTGLRDRAEEARSVESTTDLQGQQGAIPSPTTVMAIFKHYLEICGPLNLDAIAALRDFAPSENARAELSRIFDAPEVFKTEVLSRHLTLAGLLHHVGKGLVWPIPLSLLIESLKRMQPRYYSISSSAVCQPQMVSITAVVDKAEGGNGSGGRSPENHTGLATSYIRFLEQSLNDKKSDNDQLAFDLRGPRDLLASHRIFGRVRESKFKLPSKASLPVVLIGCGTGVAPFRAFVQERVRRKEIGQEVGTTLLFLGFRRRMTDFIYQKDWHDCQRTLGGDLCKTWTAFSRDPSEPKRYVQDRLEENAEEVLSLFDAEVGCRLYICGSAGMARDVAMALARVRASATGQSMTEAEAWVKELRRSKQLLEDVWG